MSFAQSLQLIVISQKHLERERGGGGGREGGREGEGERDEQTNGQTERIQSEKIIAHQSVLIQTL